MDPRNTGLFLVICGLILIVGGVLAYSGLLDWFGRLPGDIHFERGTTHVYVPLASMIVLSLILSLLLAIMHRIL